MKKRSERIKLVLMENLMLSMATIDSDVLPEDKVKALKDEYDKTDKEMKNLRKSTKPGKKKLRRAKNVKPR